MNRREYLKRLESALGFLSEDVRAAALDFYGEMIDDRMEDGKDEASAVAAMEAPEDIAARIRAEIPPEQAQETPEEAGESPRKMDASPLRDEAMEFSALVDKILRSTSQAVEQVPEMLHTPRPAEGQRQEKAEAEQEMHQARREIDEARQEMNQGFSDLVSRGMDAARRGIAEARHQVEEAMKQAEEAQRRASDGGESKGGPDVVIRVGGGRGDYQQKIFTCPADQLRAVALRVVDMPIQITPCEGNQATLVYYTCDADPYIAALRDGVLTLQNPDRAKGRGEFRINVLGGLFRMSWVKGAPTVELHLPADTLVDLLAHTSNGSIRCEGLNALCETDLETSNSRVVLERMNCKALTVKSSNGRLELRQLKCRQRVQGKTSNARIEAAQVSCGGGITLRSSNGRIRAEDMACAGPLDLITSNSGIAVLALEAPQVTLKTSNGSISGTLPGRCADWSINSGTSNGRNSLPRAQHGGRQLSAHTSNGNISIDFAQDHAPGAEE